MTKKEPLGCDLHYISVQRVSGAVSSPKSGHLNGNILHSGFGSTWVLLSDSHFDAH